MVYKAMFVGDLQNLFGLFKWVLMLYQNSSYRGLPYVFGVLPKKADKVMRYWNW